MEYCPKCLRIGTVKDNKCSQCGHETPAPAHLIDWDTEWFYMLDTAVAMNRSDEIDASYTIPDLDCLITGTD